MPLLRARTLAFAFAALALFAGEGRAGSERPVGEYELKAAFLFNFARFVEWPPEAFASATEPITIGILGPDPFGTSLTDIVRNETVRSRRLQVRHFKSIEQLEPCHLLFVASSEAHDLEQLATRLRPHSTLLVGDTKDFTDRSGMIAFETVHSRLRLRINLAAARASRLTISSQLLRQARIVGPEVAR